MKFRASSSNRTTRVLAALVVLSFGAGILVETPMPAALVGAALAAVAFCILGKETVEFIRDRSRRTNRYDLSLLKQSPHFDGPSADDPDLKPDAPSWESEEGDVVYCHRCDVSMTTALAICPHCGCPLGH